MTRRAINIHHSQRFKPTSAISLKFSNHSVRDHKFINPYEAKSTNDVQVLDTNYSQSCFQRHFSHQPPCCSLSFFSSPRPSRWISRQRAILREFCGIPRYVPNVTLFFQYGCPPNMLLRSDEGNYFLRRPALPRGTKTPLHALKYSIGEHVWVKGRLTLED